jgi:hypothetical protein
MLPSDQNNSSSLKACFHVQRIKSKSSIVDGQNHPETQDALEITRTDPILCEGFL